MPTGKQLFYPEQAFNANSLKGAGGVFNSKNINIYHYAGVNPVKYNDPDGRAIVLPFLPAIYEALVGLGAAVTIYIQGKEAIDTRNKFAEAEKKNAEVQGPPTLENAKKESDKRIKDVLEGTSQGRETKGKADQKIKEGGKSQADSDFDTLTSGSDVKTKENGTRVGKLPDGRTVNEHLSSDGKTWTNETPIGSKDLKIRYPEGSE